MKKRKNQRFPYTQTRAMRGMALFRKSTSHASPVADLPKFLTIRQASEILRVHPNTLRAWDAAGKLRAVRFGPRHDRRYVRDEVLVQAQVRLPHALTKNLIRPTELVRRVGVTVGLMVVVIGVIVSLVGRSALADASSSTTTLVAPGTCTGWANPDGAKAFDLPGTAPFDDFSIKNSARVTGSDLGVSGSAGTVTPSLDQADPRLECSGFSSKNDGSPVQAVRLRLSLAASGRVNSTELIRFSTSLDGKIWTQLTAVPVLREERNYLTIDLPTVTDREILKQLRLRAEAEFEPGGQAVAWLDGIAVLVTTTGPASVASPSSESTRHRELNRLVAFSQAAYAADDQPTILIPKKQVKTQLLFSKKTETWQLKDVVLIDSKNDIKKVEYRTVDEVKGDDTFSRLRLRMTNLHPGKYQLRVTMISPTGSTEVIAEPFLWGVLAVNLRQANPAVGDQEEITIGVLDDTGRTICNAAVTATVIDPKGKRLTVNTANDSLITNENCVDKGVTNEADYHFAMRLDHPGVYRLSVEAETKFGKRTTNENFSVAPQGQFEVDRVDYPTRIYPVVKYPTRIAVTPKADYLGLVTERVPANFVISDVFPAGSVRRAVDNNNQQIIEWLVQWKAGQTYFLTYTFDAPDVSPALFLTGPLTVGGSFIDAADFTEPREWQIASDSLIKKPNDQVAYTPIAEVPGDWDPIQPSLISLAKPIYDASEQVAVKIWTKGFALEDKPDQPVTVTTFEVIPPGGPSTGYDEADETMVQGDLERDVIYLVPNALLVPGQYTINLELEDGTTITKNFEWGTLQVSPGTGPFLKSKQVNFRLADTDPLGHPNCQSEMVFALTRPDGQVENYRLADGTIEAPAGCDPERLIQRDRFTFSFIPTLAGEYAYRLTRSAEPASRYVSGTFTVDDRPAASAAVATEIKNAVHQSRTTFRQDEQPTLDLEVKTSATISRPARTRTIDAVKLINPQGQVHILNLTPDETVGGTITLASLGVPGKEFIRPGKYQLIITVAQDGAVAEISQDFTWGVLAVNLRRSIERPNTDTQIGLAVLDDDGRTLCDATVALTVTDPSGKKKTLKTANGSIKKNPACVDKGVTNDFDYAADYTTSIAGTYQLHLVADTVNGQRAIDDTFEVRSSVDFEVERTVFSMRIYPLADYDQRLTIVAKKDYAGTVTETVPASFGISNISAAGVATTVNDRQTLSWAVDWKAGETYTLGYTIDFPDVAPEYYVLGPLVIGDFHEARQWQIASDSVGAAESARLYSTGFELQSTDADEEYTANINTPVIDTTTKRSGAASMETLLGAGSTEGARFQFKSANTQDDYYARVYLNITTAPAAETKILCFNDSTPSDQACIRMNTDRTLELWDEEDGPTQITGTSSALATGTWYRIELQYDTTTLATTVVDARIDGVSFSSASNLNHANGPRDISWGILTSTTAEFNFDDIGLNDDSGGKPTSWPGEGKIVYLRPTATVTNTCDASAVSVLQETNPDGATTTALCDVANDNFTVDVTDSATAGIGASDFIKLMAVGSQFTRISAASASSRVTLKVPSANAILNATTIADLVTTYSTHISTAPKIYQIVEFDQTDATKTDAVTPADLDSARIGYEIIDANPDSRLSTLWLLVEYNPAEGGRVFSSGFELQSTTAGVEWTTLDSTPSISTSTVRSGAATLNATATASTRKGMDYTFSAADNNGPFFYRAYVRAATLPGVESRMMDFRNTANTTIAYITLDSAGTLKLYDEDGNVGTGGTTMVTNGWYRLELKVDASGAGATDTVEAKLDGTNIATSAVRNLSTGVAQVGLGINLGTENTGTGSLFFDDVAVNKNAGSLQNGYPGAGRVVHLRPNADGDNTAWAVNVANCAATDYTCVNEVTPNDATGGVVGSSTANQIEEWNLDPSSTPGIPAGATINLVSVGVRFNNSAATLSTIALRLKDAANADSIESTDIDDITLSTYFTNNESAPRNYMLNAYTRPDRNDAWTTTQLDSAQIGARLRIDGGTNNFGMAAAWLLVDYSPSEGLTGTVYSNEGSTAIGNPPCDNSTNVVKIKINGAGSLATTCTSAASVFTQDMTVGPMPGKGDVVSIFLDNVTANATAVTRYGTSRATVNLYQDRVIVRDEDGTSISNTNLDQYDSGNEGDTIDGDVGFTVTSSNLTVSNTRELHVWTGKTFTPGGTVTTNATGTQSGVPGDLHIDTSATLTMAANALSVGGDYTNAGTLSNSGSQTTTLTATGAGFTITPGTGSFINLTINGSGGDWAPQTAITITTDLSTQAGTLKGTQNVTVNGNAQGTGGVINLTGGTFLARAAASKSFGMDGSVANTDWTFNNLTFSNSSGSIITYTVNNGTCATCDYFVTGTMKISDTGDSTGTTLSAYRIWNLTATDNADPFDMDLVSGSLTANVSTFVYSGNKSSGNVTVENATYDNLSFTPGSAEIYDTEGSTTVGTLLTVGSNATFAMGSGHDITLSATSGSVLSLSGTLNGPGRLIYRTSTAFPTTGTLGSTSIVRYDLVTNALTTAVRTDYGTIEAYNASGVSRTLTLGAGTHTLAGNLDLKSNAASSPLIVAGNTNNPAVNVTGNVATSVATSAVTLSMGSNTWTVSGDFDLTSVTTFNNNSGTLTMNGTSKTLTSNALTLNNVNLSGSITLANATHTIAGNLDLTSGTLTPGTSTVTMSGTANLVGAAQTLYNLTIDGNGNTVTVSSNTTVSNFLTVGGASDGNNDTLSINSGDTLTLSCASCTALTINDASGGTNTISGAGTFTYRSTGIFPAEGTVSVFVRFDGQGGSAQQTKPRTFGGLVEVTSSSSGTTRTLILGDGAGQTVNFNGGLFIRLSTGNTQNVTIDAATNDPTVNITDNVDDAEDGINFYGTAVASGTPIINAGTGTWTVSGSFGDVDFTGVTGPVGQYNTEAGNTLTMNGTGTLTSAGNTLLNLNLSGPITLANATHTVAGDLNMTGGTITAGTSTVTMSGASKTITGASQTLNNLTISAATTLQTTGLTVSSILSIAASTTFTITSVTLTDSGTTDVSWGASSIISGTGNLTFTSSTTGGPGTAGTLSVPVTYDASAASIPSAVFDARTYGGAVTLTANNAAARSITAIAGGYSFSSTLTTSAGGAGIVTADLSAATGTTTVTGTLSIGATTVFSAPATLSLGASFTKTGTFTHNSGLVQFTTNGATTFTGDTTFNNLTITATVAKTVTFTASSTTTVVGTWTVTGAAGQLVTLTSSTTAQWTMNPTAASVSYADISYSNNTGVAFCATFSISTNGNNTNWSISSGSSCGLSVSGTVYQTGNEATVFDCNAVNLALRVSVNGGTNTNGNCTAADGTFTVSDVTDPGAADIPVVLFIDSGSTKKGTTVTLSAAAGANITSLSLMVDRVVVSQQSATALTNALMATGDNADAGIRYNVAAGALTVESGMELHVLAGKAFTPGGTVTTTAASTAANPDGDLHVPATATMTMGTNALSIGGDLTNAGTLSVSSGQTTTFTATGTGFTVDQGSTTFQGLTFNGSGGGWSNNAAMTAAQALTMTAGELSGTNDVTVNGDVVGTAGTINKTGGTFLARSSSNQNFGPTTASTLWTFYDLTFGNSHASTGITYTTQSCATCTVTVSDIMRIGKSGDAAGATTTLDAGNRTWTLSGAVADPLVLLGSPLAVLTVSSSIFNFAGVNGGGNVNINIVNYSGLTVSGAETYDLATGITVSGALSVSNASAILSIASSQTLTHSGSALTLTGTISGAGRLTYQSATALPATGTLSSILRMDATNNDQSITCSGGGRTLGGAVEFYNNSASARVITLCGTTSHVLNITGAVTVEAAGAGGLTVEGNTYDPDVTVTGTLSTGTAGGGTETVSLGGGTWTSADNISFSNSTISNTTGGTVKQIGTSVTKTITAGGNTLYNYTVDGDALIGGPADDMTVTNTITVGGAADANNDTLTIATGKFLTSDPSGSVVIHGSGTDTFGSTGTGTIVMQNSNLSTNGVVNRIRFDATNGDITAPARTYDALVAIYNTSNTNDRTVIFGTAGGQTFTLNSTLVLQAQGNNNVTLEANTYDPTMNVVGVNDAGSGSGSETLSMGSGTWTNNQLFSIDGTGSTITNASGTLDQTGIAKTFSILSNTLNNLIFTGLPSLTSGAIVTGNLTLNSSTVDAAQTWTMTGTSNTITGSGASIFNLTIDPSSAGTYSLIGSDLTVTGTLTVASGDTLALSSGRTLTDTNSSNISPVGTISGAGTLRFTDVSGGPGTTGTISSVVRYDATAANVAEGTFDARTYGGQVELYSNSASSRSVIFNTGTYIISGASSHLYAIADGAGDININGTTFNPTVTIGGDLDFTGSGGGPEDLNTGTGTWTAGGNVDFTGGTATFASGSTLAMNGTGTLTTNGQTLQNFTTSGSGTITLANATHTVAGNLALGSSATITPGTSTVTMTGLSKTIDGGGQTLNNLTIDPASASTITLQNTDVTVSALLTTAAGDTLAVDTGRTVTLSGNTGTTLTNNGQVSGSGRLTYQNSATTISAGGGISAILRFDTVNGNMTMPSIDFDNDVEIFNSTATARTVTAGTSHIFTGNLYLIANGASPGDITLKGDTNNPPVEIYGNLDFTGSGSGTEIIIAGTNSWQVNSSADLTGGTYTATAGNTLYMAGTGTLTTAGNTLDNLTMSGTYTLANATHTVAGNLSFSASTITAGSSTIVMTGTSKTIDGDNQTLNNLTISGTAALQTADLTVSGTLTVSAAKTMTINSGRILTDTGGDISWGDSASTITGAGILRFTDASGGPGTGGTLSSITRYDAAGADIVSTTFDARTYGGRLELYNIGSSNRIITPAAGTYTTTGTSSHLWVVADGTGNTTVAGATNNPTMTIGGDLDFTGSNSGTEIITSGTGTWTSSGSVDFSSGTYTATTGNTLTLNGTSKNLITASQTLQNLTISGSITLHNSTATIAGNLTLTGSTITAGSSTVVMSGSGKTIDGGGQTLNNLSVTDDTTLQNTDLTASGTLSVSSGKTLTINVSRTLSHTGSGDTSFTGGTISGAGTLRYTNTSGGPGTTGTLSSIVRFDATTASVATGTVDARTYGGAVEFFSNVAGVRTITMPSGTFTLSSDATLITGASQSSVLTLDASNGGASNPTVNITGNLAYTKAGSAIPAITTGTGTWTVTGNVTLTNGTFTATTNNTLVMNGISKAIAGNDQTVYNFTVDPTSTSTITQTSDLHVNGTVTIAADDTLSINSTIQLFAANSSEISWGNSASTMTGAGKVVFGAGSGGPGTGGVLSAITVYYGATPATTVDARTYGNIVRFTIDGGVTATATLGTGTFTLSGSSANFEIVNDAGAFADLIVDGEANNPTVNVGGNLTTGGGSTAQKNLKTGTGTWTVSGNVNFSASGSNITYTSGNTLIMNGTAKTLNTPSANTLSNLTISGSITQSIGTMTVGGNFTISGSSSFDANTALTISGNWSNSGTFNNNFGLVVFGGSAPQTLTTNNTLTNASCGGSTITQTSGKQFYDVAFSSSGSTVSLAAGSDLGVDDNFQITNGTFDIGDNSNQIYIKGNFDMSTVAGSAFNGRTSTYTACPQIIMNADDIGTATLSIKSGETLAVESIAFGDIATLDSDIYTLASVGGSTATLAPDTLLTLLSGTLNLNDGSNQTVNINDSSGSIYVGDSFNQHNAKTKIFNANDASITAADIYVSDGQTSGSKPSTFNAMTSTIDLSSGTNGRIFVGDAGNATYDDNTFSATTASTNGITAKGVRVEVGDIQATSNRAWTLTGTSGIVLAASTTVNATGSTSTWNVAGGIDISTGVTFNTGTTTFVQNGTAAASIDSDVNLTFNNLTFDDSGNRTLTIADTDTNSRRFAVNGTFTWDGTVAANAADVQIGSTSFTATLALDNNTVANSSATVPTGRTLTTIGASVLELAGNFTNNGTLIENTGKILMDGTNSSTLNSGCSNTDTCTTTNVYDLEINKTGAADGDDNVSLTSNGIRLTNTLTITDGELIQGALNVRAEGSTAVSVGAAGKWSNISTGDIKFGGTMSNAGTVYWDKDGNNNGCDVGDTDDITLTTTDGATVRDISGAGVFTFYDLTVNYMNATVAITVNGGTDGGTNTGSWTFQVCGITVSGTIYTNDATAALDCSVGGARTVAVRVNGGSATTSTCTLNTGAFLVSPVTVTSAGDVITVYISGATEKAVTVTLATNTSSNITSLPLRTDRLVVSHESAGPITNSATVGLGRYDKDDDATNFFFTSNANNLSVDAGKELVVNTNKTYTPGGTVTTAAAGTAGNPDGDLLVQSGATVSMGTNALSVGGDYTNAGTFSKSATQTTTLTATGSGFTLTPGTGNFANLIQNGSGGTYTAQAATTIDENLTVTAGIFAMGANALSVGSTGAANSGTIKVASGQSLTQSSGSTTTMLSSAAGANCIGSNGASCAGTVGTISLGALTIGDASTSFTTTFGGTTPSLTTANTLTVTTNATFTGGTSTLNVDGNFTNDGTFTNSGGTLTMNGTGTLTTGTATLGNFTTTGSGTITLANATHALAGNLNLGSSATLTAGTSTVNMTGSSKTIDGGGQTLSGLTITDNTTLQNTDLTASGTLTVAAGKTLTINVNRTLTHTGATLTWGNGASTISGAGTLRFTDVSGGPDTGGTLSSVVRFDATAANIASTTFDARTYGGVVELYADNTIAANRTVSCADASTYTLSGAGANLYLINNDNENTLTLACDTATDPTVNIGGTIDYTGTGSSTEIIQTGAGTWTVSGNIDTTGGTFTATSGNTLVMNGVGKSITWNTTTTLYNLTIDPSSTGTITLNTNTGINAAGLVTIATGDTFDITSRALSLNRTSGTPLVLNGTITGTTGTMNYLTDDPFPTTGTVDSNVAFKNNGTATTLIVTGRTYGKGLIISNNDGVLRTIRLGNGASETITVGTFLEFDTIGGGDLTVDGTTNNPNVVVGTDLSYFVSSGTTTVNSGTGTWTVSGNADFTNGNYSATAGNTLKMNGTLKSITPAGETFANFEVSGGSLTQVGAMTVSGTFVESAGAFTQAANNDLLITGSAFTLSSSTTFTKASGTGKLILDGNPLDFTDSNATKQDLGNVRIGQSPATTNLKSDKSVTSLTIPTTDTYNTRGWEVDVSGALDCQGTCVLDMTDTAGANYEGDGSIITVGANFTMSASGTFTHESTGGRESKIYMKSTAGSDANRTITTGGKAFRILEIDNGGATNDDMIVSGNLTVDGTLTVTDGQFDLTTNDPTTDLNGAVTIASTGELLASNSATTTIAGNYTNSGAFTDNGGTVTIDGAAQQTLSGQMTGSGDDFNNLTITNNSGSDPAASPSVILGAALDTADTFTAATNNVKLRFNAGSTYALAAINFSGSSGNIVYLRSSTPGTVWNINAGAGARTVVHTAVRDSNACGSTGGSIDGNDGTNFDEGNTSCWNINSISMSISDTTIGFGTCAPGAAQYATGTTGSSSDSADAHTITLATSAHAGYALTVFGPTLTSAGNTITGLGGSAVASSPGSEQFGLRAIKNSGAGAVTSPYDTANWAFGASSTPQPVASHSANASTTVIGLRYICNVAGTTEPGTYSTDLTYVLTGTF